MKNNTAIIDGREINFTVEILNHEKTKSVTLEEVSKILKLYSEVCTETGLFAAELTLPLLIKTETREAIISINYKYAIKVKGKTPTSYSEANVAYSISSSKEINSWLKDESNEADTQAFLKLARYIGKETMKDSKPTNVSEPMGEFISLTGMVTIH